MPLVWIPSLPQGGDPRLNLGRLARIGEGMHRFFSVALVLLAWVQGSRAEFSDSLLHGLEGVGIEVRPLHQRSEKLSLTEGMLRERLARELNDLQVGILSPDDLEGVPGRPYLELTVHVAHAQAPSHFYTIVLRLKEMALLERPQNIEISMALSTWERESLGVANRPEAVLQALDRLIRLFSEEFHRSNVEE